MGNDLSTTDAPMGLQPYGNVLHAGYYAVVTNNAVEVCVGDMVETAGTVLASTFFGKSLVSVIPEETGASGTIVGAVLAVYDSDGIPTDYLAASTTGDGTVAGYVLVADDENQEYVAQEDGDTSSLVAANIGLNIDMIKTHAASSVNSYLSKMELDSSTVANTNTLALRLLGVHPDDSISSAGAAGNYCRFIVKLNTAYRGAPVTGA